MEIDPGPRRKTDEYRAAEQASQPRRFQDRPLPESGGEGAIPDL